MSRARSWLAFLCCVFGVAYTGCAALAIGAAGGVLTALDRGVDDVLFRSGPTVDTTYQSDVPTVTGLVSQIVTEHTAQSQFALTRSTTKDDPTDREIQLHSAQGSKLVLRVQDANENGAVAARLRIWAYVETDIKIIGANRKDMGAEDEFREIIYKLRQETAKRKLKVLRDTRATESD